jgi:TPR repeat protein
MNGHGVKRNQEEGERYHPRLLNLPSFSCPSSCSLSYLLNALLIRWFRSAASSGNAEACFNLGVIAREDGRRDEAASFFRQASALGLKEAKHELA